MSEEMLEPGMGKWIRRWDKYPHDMLALLLEAHNNGYKSPPIEKAVANSLKVRLQKMTSGIRNQDGVPAELASASESVQWSADPYIAEGQTETDAYQLIGKHRKRPLRITAGFTRGILQAPKSAETALQAVLERAHMEEQQQPQHALAAALGDLIRGHAENEALGELIRGNAENEEE